MRVHEEMLQVIVHTPLTVLRDPRAPNQAIKENWHQRRRVETEPLDDVFVALEKDVHAVVVAIAVSTDGQQVCDDGPSTLQAARLNGPHQR
eukprot:CAMPEP_0115617176 /NCGR_PEP_ID=MMETSP0272-20121206/23513_1 /TAXON_ID=71861 /ORGANISM="Scrippsiella trochoidea, Strain CCMP3099" /LENGTH=90 /DNA_ID=CAMNT_0003053131 /DNA_START=87 /DNA_END=359 /DNA_ORIENTATION=+